MSDHERIAELEAEVSRLKRLLDRDHTGLAAGLVAVQRAVGGWFWIPAGEWGSYGWPERTEQALREEVSRCFEEVDVICSTALRESGTRAGAAFVPERDQLGAALAENERLRAELARCQPVAATLAELPVASEVVTGMPKGEGT